MTMHKFLVLATLVCLLVQCSLAADPSGNTATTPPKVAPSAQSGAKALPAHTEKAIFAGGCFWGMQYYMERVKGVVSTEVGYIGGQKPHPTYEYVHSGDNGYAEAVEVTFDPRKTTYEKLAKYFFDIHDPTQLNRQGPDIGSPYRSAVFYRNPHQKAVAEKLIKILKDKGYKVVTQVVPAGHFWPAAAYHQHYYDKQHSAPYCHVFTNRFQSKS